MGQVLLRLGRLSEIPVQGSPIAHVYRISSVHANYPCLSASFIRATMTLNCSLLINPPLKKTIGLPPIRKLDRLSRWRRLGNRCGWTIQQWYGVLFGGNDGWSPAYQSSSLAGVETAS